MSNAVTISGQVAAVFTVNIDDDGVLDFVMAVQSDEPTRRIDVVPVRLPARLAHQKHKVVAGNTVIVEGRLIRIGTDTDDGDPVAVDSNGDLIRLSSRLSVEATWVALTKLGQLDPIGS